MQEGLKVGKTIIVWVSSEEKEDNQDKDYFVAKIGERAVKLEEDGTYRAVPFRKNDWIVSVHWYDFAPPKRNEKGIGFIQKDFPNGFLVVLSLDVSPC